MQYALLVYETNGEFEARQGDEAPGFFAAWRAYSQALRDSGVWVSGSGLRPASTGTTVRTASGERLVQDGPYPETKEQLAGFITIEVPDLDAALEWAGRCPTAQVTGGVVEVRPCNVVRPADTVSADKAGVGAK